MTKKKNKPEELNEQDLDAVTGGKGGTADINVVKSGYANLEVSHLSGEDTKYIGETEKNLTGKIVASGGGSDI